MTSARRRAGWLLYAALQFIVLTACAMATYTGGTWFDPATTRYELTGNFLSDLGTTHAFSGHTNYVSSVLFLIALSTIGAAIIGFAWAWRGFAFGLGRARVAGIASQVLGTASGLAFIGIAVTPWDLALAAHNRFVVAAFSLLLGYVVCLTIAMWRNGIARVRVAVNLAYLALVLGYVAIILFGPRLDTPSGHLVQVTAQKLVAYGSMLHIIYLTITTRRALSELSAGTPRGDETGPTIRPVK